jgi:hypothetical protein
MLLKERSIRWEDKEEDVCCYWMILRKRKDVGTGKSKC